MGLSSTALKWHYNIIPLCSNKNGTYPSLSHSLWMYIVCILMSVPSHCTMEKYGTYPCKLSHSLCMYVSLYPSPPIVPWEGTGHIPVCPIYYAHDIVCMYPYVCPFLLYHGTGWDVPNHSLCMYACMCPYIHHLPLYCGKERDIVCIYVSSCPPCPIIPWERMGHTLVRHFLLTLRAYPVQSIQHIQYYTIYYWE